eukprot:scaffold200982_cov32-Tisochrysis_lutea.AAC.2
MSRDGSIPGVNTSPAMSTLGIGSAESVTLKVAITCAVLGKALSGSPCEPGSPPPGPPLKRYDMA